MMSRTGGHATQGFQANARHRDTSTTPLYMNLNLYISVAVSRIGCSPRLVRAAGRDKGVAKVSRFVAGSFF